MMEPMLSDDYADRFRAEYEQVQIRAERLESILEAWRKGELGFTPDCSYALLNSQLMAMKAYLRASSTSEPMLRG